MFLRNMCLKCSSVFLNPWILPQRHQEEPFFEMIFLRVPSLL